MTVEQLTAAGIPTTSDAGSVLRAEAALDWLADNTTLSFDKADAGSVAALPACAKLFVIKYCETLQRESGLTSQSIEGLSTSYAGYADGNGVAAMIFQLAQTLLGAYMKSQVRSYPARRKW